jgi:predicted SnoaL-like aldol condensation-catalyzing enzyme
VILGPALALALSAAPAASCQGSAAESVALVRGFYTTALLERQVEQGFLRDVSPDFVEHKPDIASGDRDGAIVFLSGLVTELPQARWELVRITGDAELVAVHARFVPAPGAEPFAIADFFRIKDCLIVEHWDVVAGPPREPANPQSRF